MKKILCLMVVLLVLLLMACATEVQPAPNVPPINNAEVAAVRTAAPTATNNPIVSDTKYSDMIPDPTVVFANGNISITDIDGGDAYIFEVIHYADGEYESYISQCKRMGFNQVSYETGEEFGAYTQDKQYWVEVTIDNEDNIIYVICQTSKDK